MSGEETRALHEARMREALTLARESLTRTSPNPRVGCVIYAPTGERLAEGVTAPPGGAHAEAAALAALAERGVSAAGAWVYVTLEPCAHFGRTPPCANALIAAGVGRVYVGAGDPNPLVGGQGVARLREAGVSVEEGVLHAECADWHAPFFRWIATRRPWVTLKGAMTLDGCLATASGDSKWITGEAARAHAHSVRAQMDAVIVGGETARLDRPALTVRLSPGSSPTPVVLSRALDLPDDLPCGREGAVFVCAEGLEGTEEGAARAALWRGRGVRVVGVPLAGAGGGLDLPATLSALGALGLTRVMVEGGGRLLGAILEAGLADEAWVYVAPKLIGRGRPLFDLRSVGAMREGWGLQGARWEVLGADVCVWGRLSGPA
jgi:diaminohydroxyphosphoribosylaminopyrimidine deaminase/5-amino-6-(5-phosphoribosylamino)uracil reductase